jgi:hypothetical protein
LECILCDYIVDHKIGDLVLFKGVNNEEINGRITGITRDYFQIRPEPEDEKGSLYLVQLGDFRSTKKTPPQSEAGHK